MRYHRLGKEELEELQQEMIHFLAAQSITAHEWESIKGNEPERMNELIDQFSDMVIHRALTNIKALRIVSQHELYLFLFEEQNARVMHFSLPPESAYAFTDSGTIEALSSGKITLKDIHATCYKGEKTLGDREAEMYALVVQGAVPCSKEDYHKIVAGFG